MQEIVRRQLGAVVSCLSVFNFGRIIELADSAYEEIEEFLKPLFQSQYTMQFENYPVELERLERAEVRTV